MALDQPSLDDKTRYETLRKELATALTRKRAIDRQLAQTEHSLYELESTYLTDTAAHSGGNIIQGFEGYLKTTTVGRRKFEISDSDRLFSTSSMTYKKSLDMLGEVEDSLEDLRSLSARATLVLPPVSASASAAIQSSSAEQKKIRDKEYQRRKRANMARRSAGTVSDEEGSQVSTGASTPVSSRRNKRMKLGDE